MFITVYVNGLRSDVNPILFLVNTTDEINEYSFRETSTVSDGSSMFVIFIGTVSKKENGKNNLSSISNSLQPGVGFIFNIIL